MTGETARRAPETTRSRRELLQQLGVVAVGAGAVTAAGSGTARAASEFDVEIVENSYPEEMVASPATISSG